MSDENLIPQRIRVAITFDQVIATNANEQNFLLIGIDEGEKTEWN